MDLVPLRADVFFNCLHHLQYPHMGIKENRLTWKHHLLLGEIWLNDCPITNQELYVWLLNDQFFLSHVFRTDDEPLIQFFLLPMISTHIKGWIFDFVREQTKNHRGAATIYANISKDFTPMVFESILWGLYMKLIKHQDIEPLFCNIRTWGTWSKFENLLKNSPFLEQEASHAYKPWLLILKESLQMIETENDDLKAFDAVCQDIILNRMKTWLRLPNHKNIFTWLMTFLFKDHVTGSKRKFLYLKGVPSVGKTTFLMNMFPARYFKNLAMSSDFFNAIPKGEYCAHNLIWEDPAPFKGNSSLKPEFFLRLALGGIKNQQMKIAVKHGFAVVKKAQVIFASNHEIDYLFGTETAAMLTRLYKVEFEEEHRFPLQMPLDEEFEFVLRNQPQDVTLNNIWNDEMLLERLMADSDIYDCLNEDLRQYGMNHDLSIEHSERNENYMEEEEKMGEQGEIGSHQPQENMVEEEEEGKQQEQRFGPSLDQYSHILTTNYDTNQLKSPHFSEDVVYYFLWKAILEILSDDLQACDNYSLNYYFFKNQKLWEKLLRTNSSFWEAFMRLETKELAQISFF